VTALTTTVAKLIWEPNVASMPPWKAHVMRTLRLVVAVVQDLAAGQLTLRAMSLVYTTLLSLVPLLAVSFSVLKGFGVHNQIEPLLANVLAPLGPRGAEITEQIVGFVDNMSVGILGSVGLGMLLYTVLSLIHKIEHSFNFIWHATQTRTALQRFSNYLSVVMIGPVLMFSAVGITVSVMNTAVIQSLAAIEPFGTAINWATRLVPYLLIIGAFTFVYAFVPNTRVQLSSALVGAIAAGVCWQAAGWGFAAFIASSTRYTAIYKGFAILVMFMIWLYISWLVLLVGASIAFYHQYPERVVPDRTALRLSSRLKEKLALLVMLAIGRDHYEQRRRWTLQDLARRCGLPQDALAPVVDALERHGLLTQTAADPPVYVPQRALETIQLADVLDAVRAEGETPFLEPERLPREANVDDLVRTVDGAIRFSLANRTLRELVLRAEPGAAGHTTGTDPAIGGLR
jgi:membrane protein